MKGSDFDELAFFDAIARSEVRALLIGRRALVVLGLPVLTAACRSDCIKRASRPKDLEDIRLLELVGPEGAP